MLREAIYHRPKNNWSYAYDRETIHIRVRTKRDDVVKVTLIHGDKYSWSVIGSQKIDMNVISRDHLFDYWHAEVKPTFRRLKYGFKFQSANDTIWLNEQGFHESEPENQNLYFDFPFLNPADVFTPPSWVKDAIFYQIFPERFANGDPSIDPEDAEPWGGEPKPHNFFGGDLQGIIDHLDYLTELGVNAIYFNPLFEAPTNHKYDTIDYLKIDPHFGTNEKMKELVEACHSRGIKVLLDAVFNHSGGRFPPFLDVKENGAESRYADWFHVREFPLEVRDRVPTYDTFAFEAHMPKLNTENAEVQQYLLEVARYWIEEIGVDGWRLDVANEVDHRFWRKFRDVVKAANPEAYILGEIWHDSQPWLAGDQFDAVMNYPLTDAILDYAVKETRDGRQFADLVGYLHAAYPQQAAEVAFNLLGSHDTPRLLTICGEDKRRMKLATVIQFTLSGTPCVYYGDEVGLTGEHDPGCRKCMEWDESKQDRDLFRFFAELIKLRKDHRALRDGTYELLYSESGIQAVAFAREYDCEKFFIALNAGNVDATVVVAAGKASSYEVVFGEAQVDSTGTKVQVALPPVGFAILRAN
ncbi:glycoside hydrolase family 13 protein [Cohnella herbarum]|uniref:Alpha-glycosidase n=1 Tax=Cohnella herbarum TaxID=2728023 RepID=A0A7Z2VQX3_9BACL|nr:glycoside hydrolase family 13 protein [Cohnella herbarum]QJD87828.1 alpha-glycosidase [Cohnella herbarum]